MAESNLKRLHRIAGALGELNDKVVYVGGAVAELYVNDPAATDICPTLDVDCVIKLSSYNEFNELSKQLRKKKFKNDISPDAPICRWIYQGEKVDIMPDDKDVIGFSNKWYSVAFEKKESRILFDDIVIYIFPIAYYVATKFEALKDRGGDDYRAAHDFEDIIYILNSCDNFMESLHNDADDSLKQYIKEKMCELISRSNIMEEISCALPVGEYDRADYIFEIMQEIAKY